MELLYLNIVDDGMTIKDQNFNFSNQFSFTFKRNDESNGEIQVADQMNYIEDFFGLTPNLILDEQTVSFRGSIINVTAIIGENGTGKTNLLNFLIKLLTDALPLGEEFIVAFKEPQANIIHIYHTIKNCYINAVGQVHGFKINQPVEQITVFQREIGNYYKAPAKLTNKIGLIYYNPIFDFRDYPANIATEYKDYIDVSTNALVENDVWRFGDSQPAEMDKLALYRSSNVRRQFELILNSGLSGINGMNFPNEISISFYRDSFSLDGQKRNLSTENERIFESLDNDITKEFSRVNGVLHNYERQGDEKIRRSKSGYENEPGYIQALKDKLKVEFLYSLIHNYFRNLNHEYHEEIGMETEQIVGKGLFDRATYFFTHQKWRGSKSQPIVNTEGLCRVVLNHIDRADFKKHRIDDNDNSLFVNIIGGVEILSNYESYINSIPSDYVRNFISLNWRNLSSGESAMFDLYSRLYFALKRRLEIKEAESGKEHDIIYILIDEGEAGFHPQWQREYLDRLLHFIKLVFVNYPVQLILTSHSPFLVSDLPKENLIFLEKNNGLCKVDTFIGEQTFAGNIHALFSHQFFMKNSVIGKFAQNKMNEELMGLLENTVKKVDIDRLKKFINIIGEPVLQLKLREILKQKYPNV